MIRGLFHAGCAAVLATSILFVARGDVAPVVPDPREQLQRFMSSKGYARTSEREILGGETLYTFAREGCADAVRVVYLPEIHRISDVSRQVFRQEPTVYVHDGGIVEDLGAVTLIPRWLWRRALVNLQAAPENPWISIALAVQDPAHCLQQVPVDWARLPAS
ncbi:hypothetical protein [Alsobacter sp. R-9]